jgi:hypothetical protein
MKKLLWTLSIFIIISVSDVKAQYAADSQDRADFFKLRESLEGYYQI